jgi:hypothetical protein
MPPQVSRFVGAHGVDAGRRAEAPPLVQRGMPNTSDSAPDSATRFERPQANSKIPLRRRET